MIRGMKPFSGTERLRRWSGSTWKRLQGDLTEAFQCLKGTYMKDGDRLFNWACCIRTKGNGFELKEI